MAGSGISEPRMNGRDAVKLLECNCLAKCWTWYGLGSEPRNARNTRKGTDNDKIIEDKIINPFREREAGGSQTVAGKASGAVRRDIDGP